VTEPWSRGLIPQLTDVLRALTESQALLLTKVHNVRLEHGGWPALGSPSHPHITGASPATPTAQAEPEIATPAQAETPAQTPAQTELPTASPIEPPLVRPLRTERPGAPRHEMTGHSEPASEREPAPRPSPDDTAPAPVHTPFVGEAWNDEQQGDVSTTGQESDADAANAYNFFDELDARLAHLDESDPVT
jgi:hypothetical protein